MCGIAGIVRTYAPGDPAPHPLESIPEHWLDVLDESIKHRGPDGQGRFRDRALRDDGSTVDIALVHRRLSIIDHADGHQPMVHDGERLRPDLTYQPGEEPKLAHELAPGVPIVAVVFNGCIYNHRELRAKLEAAGHRFGTDHSDTEVLVHGWRAWELRQIEKLDGMYAVITWDRASGQLAWGRDLAGEKPLYQSRGADGTRIFASCMPGLAELGPATVHLPGIEGWIHFGAALLSPTPAFGVRPLQWSIWPESPRRGAEPADAAFDGSAMRSVGLRHLPPDRSQPGGRDLRSADDAHRLIETAVGSRLDADVPLGVFLSGGIDSALIASIVHKQRPDAKAFTVRMPDRRFDESEAAAETARHLGIEHHILDCDPQPAEDLVRVIEQLGLPFGDSSLLPTSWVCRAAREQVKVALSGDGGDELFGGYRRHAITPVLNRWRHLLRLIPTMLLDRRDPASRPTALARLATAARYGGYHELIAIFPTPDIRALLPSIDGERTGSGRFDRIDDPLRHDFEHYLPEDLLRKTDTASMAVGLEVRSPFLAGELVDAALRTPLDLLMPGGQRKGLLKQVARKHLPDHIVDRPKRGFAIPIGEWFRTDFGGMRQLLHDHLGSTDPFPGLAEAGVNIDMNFVRKMLREHDAAGEKSINPWHGRDHSQRLYMLLVLSIWAKWLEGVRRGHA
ncbi:MAG: asparagine synthase (glutamine-hydrolyzing) [Phycisphaerales bacterium JB037]